jgi:hypothetical protein
MRAKRSKQREGASSLTDRFFGVGKVFADKEEQALEEFLNHYINVAWKSDLRSLDCRVGVSPAIERLTLAGETPALLSKVQQRAAVDISARSRCGSAFIQKRQENPCKLEIINLIYSNDFSEMATQFHSERVD